VGLVSLASITLHIKNNSNKTRCIAEDTLENSDGEYIPDCPGPFNALFIIANHHRQGIRFKTTTKIGPILSKLSFSFVKYDAKKIVKW